MMVHAPRKVSFRADGSAPTLDGLEILAPLPGFRYVWLAPEGSHQRSVAPWLTAGLGAAGVVATLAHFASGPALLAAGAASLATTFLRRRLAPDADRVALVPWGVLVETDATLRALLWASVAEVDWAPVGSTWGGISSISHSRIRIDTRLGTYSGKSQGEAPLAGLGANLAAYTEEQAHVLALDLDDDGLVTLVGEPACEAVCRAARSLVGTAQLRAYLGIDSIDYRGERGRVVSPEGVAKLRSILRDRVVRVPDRRGLVCALVGELELTALLEDLFWLVSCPNPTIAALAKHAAVRAGGSLVRAGGLDEIAPFLHGGDVEYLMETTAS